MKNIYYRYQPFSIIIENKVKGKTKFKKEIRYKKIVLDKMYVSSANKLNDVNEYYKNINYSINDIVLDNTNYKFYLLKNKDHPLYNLKYGDSNIYEALVNTNNSEFDNICYLYSPKTNDLNKSIFQSIAENVGIACFSTNLLDPVMWAFYAEQNTGFSLGYEVDASCFSTNSNYELFDKVDYLANTPEISVPLLFENPSDLIKEFFFKKTNSWSFENEFRFLTFNNLKNYSIDLPHGFMLVEIVLGLYSPEKQTIYFKKFCKKNNLKLYKIQISHGNFKKIPVNI